MFISDTLSRAALPLTQQLKDKSEFLVFRLNEEFALNAEIEKDNMEHDIFVTDDSLFINLCFKSFPSTSLLHARLYSFPDNSYCKYFIIVKRFNTKY